MKKLACVAALVAAVCAVSCNKNPQEDPVTPVEEGTFDPFAGEKATSFTGYAVISVPLATTEVYVEYTGANGETKTVVTPVKPEMAAPVAGKDAEPFGTVKFLFSAPVQTKVSVYYKAGSEVLTKADENAVTEDVYTLTDFPLDKVQNDGYGPGISRYFHMNVESFYYDRTAESNYQPVPNYPKDLLYYDAAHNHTLRYKFAYSGTGNGAAYFLDEAYTIEDYVVTGVKYNYCGGCENCALCMPWGCSCGCAHANNPAFVPSGDTTSNSGNDTVVIGDDPTPINGGGNEDEPVVSVDEHGTIIVDYDNSNINVVTLPEPASYVTKSGDQTFYHSSGVVMFDDSWPQMPLRDEGAGAYDYDYNDVVVDYDVEAKTVADNILESEGWREQVKVVLHLRALGGTLGWRVGMVLENFNTDYVASVDEYMTLDSYQNTHGELPAWASATAFTENSIHYDQFAKQAQFRNGNNLRPAIEIGQLQAFNGSKWDSAAGKDTYFYINGEHSAEHVFNPGLKLYDAWGGVHTEQYSEGLADKCRYPNTLEKILGMSYYNTIPGYVNVAGGLYTYTVIYNMKPRADMDPVQREIVKQNMIDAVVNTTAQNFFIVKQDNSAVGLKGYAPLDYPVKGINSYKAKYDELTAANADHLNTANYYEASDGTVWAFKCPTLTKHVWEKLYFGKAYPNYEAWVRSNGAEHQDWYKDADVDGDLHTCWW